MCGICGVIGGAPGEVRLMADRLRHRGPDDEGFHDGKLGFRRLSIIDLETGAQPMQGCGDLWIVFNGEIYNFRELRARLERTHPFRSRSDTEVILHLYEDKGAECVKELDGMFAFAIWDGRTRTLFAARDRMGKKPFVYRHEGERFQFASELAALDLPRSVDRRALEHYLAFGYIPAPMTIYEGVRKLPPAHTLVYDGSGVRVEPYWEPIARIEDGGEDAYAERVFGALSRAVHKRLVADVPVGAFLSGGIDSSIVAGLMSQMQPAQTFSIGFREAGYSEVGFAREAARHFRTQHREFEVRPSAAEVLPVLVERYGEPFGDSSCIPTYYVAKMTAQHVKVALSGDGGDELFGGYLRHEAILRLSRLKEVPSPILAAASVLVPGRTSRRERLRRLLRRSGEPLGRLYADLMTIFPQEMRRQLGFTEGESLEERHLERRFMPHQEDPLLAAGMTDLQTYLPGDILAKVDIASMACSLEVRCPFLDREVVDLALTIPSRIRRGKRVLKRAFRGLLPRAVHDRGKMGFGVPLAEWLRGELRPMLEDALATLRKRGPFEGPVIDRLALEHQSGAADHKDRLWLLLVYELWARRFLDR
jgi:asparagine synthase (glutamine-hydrolysing)